MSAWSVSWRVAGVVLALRVSISAAAGGFRSDPKPITYEVAMQLAVRLERADSLAVPMGRSVVRVHGHRTPRAFVLFHGFTNSPRQYRTIVDSIYNAGDNVVVPRLPWHALRGGTSKNLSKMTADALRDVAALSVDIASGLGDTVIVFGVSLGGNLAAWTAQFRPVYRAVIAAPALGLSHLSTSVQNPVMDLMLIAPAYSRSESPDTLRPDRTLGWNTRGLGEMLKLGLAVRRAAEERRPLARDIRVLANLGDETINRSAIDELVRHWRDHGARVNYYELSDTLKLPHDIVDPDEKNSRTGITNPVILALVRGQKPIAAARLRSPL